VTLDWRARRIASNESAFRDVNERLEGDLGSLELEREERIEFVCECGDRECEQSVVLTLAEYEHIRSDGRHFAVAIGHVYPEAERVVERHASHEVVEKRGDGADLAEQRDPR